MESKIENKTLEEVINEIMEDKELAKIKNEKARAKGQVAKIRGELRRYLYSQIRYKKQIKYMRDIIKQIEKEHLL